MEDILMNELLNYNSDIEIRENLFCGMKNTVA